MASKGSSPGLTVAVTGPTGDIGKPFLRALDKTPGVGRVIGMARRPFDPADLGLNKTEYRQGDVLDRASVDDLVREADVVVHLAFLIFGTPEEARLTNLEGSTNVFSAAFEAGVKRLVYASSVAAYGFHQDNPGRLTEDVAARGSDGHYYSAQKAEVETVLEDLRMGSGAATDVYVFRPCIVAGPTATTLIEKIPFVKLGDKIPGPVRKLVGAIPLLRPVVPDPGVPFQLVHEDDVASALALAVRGKGAAGAYNLAADGDITVSDIAQALGWYSIPIPELAVDATAKIISRLPLLPVEAQWLDALRVPVLMDTTKACTELGWEPSYDVLDTLAETIQGARHKGLLPWRGGREAQGVI
ncbi:MAG: NAD-dependent epimerase/dehydratase family protein [Actinomycetota bacterium]|nr:NAD-dependent epimerase/dehydratase family protein [Actinomycetota bacterium]